MRLDIADRDHLLPLADLARVRAQELLFGSCGISTGASRGNLRHKSQGERQKVCKTGSTTLAFCLLPSALAYSHLRHKAQGERKKGCKSSSTTFAFCLLPFALCLRLREPRMEWMEANGVSLRYELAGVGAETVVFVHELGGGLESWDETLPAFQKHFSTLRYDQRGFGLSEKTSGTLALDDMVADIAALLDALSIEKPCHLVGSA